MQLKSTLQSEKFASVLKRTAFLKLVFWTYIIFGAIIFSYLEFEAREEEIEEAVANLEEERRGVLEVLWAHTLSKSEEDWMELANRKLDMYERELQEQLAAGIDMADTDEDGEEDDDNPWDLFGAIFFAFTTITTIGYGNICPITTAGKLFTIVYATVGVPLCLIFLAEVGKMLTLVLKAIMKKAPEPVEEGSYASYSYDEEVTEDFDFTLLVAVGVTVAWMCLGALVFDLLNDEWDFVDAAYFCFVTFSTLGFGDYVPEGGLETLFWIWYNTLALSLCAMCFTVLQASLEFGINERYDGVKQWVMDKQSCTQTRSGRLVRFLSRIKEEKEE